MGRLIKWLIYLALVGAVALIGYAYLGPFFGADFSADTQEVTQSVELDAQ